MRRVRASAIRGGVLRRCNGLVTAKSRADVQISRIRFFTREKRVHRTTP